MNDIAARIDDLWDEVVMPTLTEYITIPNVSPRSTRRGQSTGTWSRR